MNEINLSLDGVQESRSSNISNDVYSMTFKNCQKVFPIRLIRPINKYKVDSQYHLQQVLNDININSIKIHSIIGDKPKRSFLKMFMNSNATYGCDYCESPAVLFRNTKKIEELEKKTEKLKESIISQIETIRSEAGPSSNQKKIDSLNRALQCIDLELKTEIKKYSSTNLCWPHSTLHGDLRTLEKVNDIVELIQNSEIPLERHVAKGIVGRSLLLDQEEFDMINDAPTEYMHCTCLGAVKRLTELTFNVGQTRSRNTKRKLSDPKKFNLLIITIQVPHEFSRRCRNLDFAIYKASEFRNIILFFFPIVLQCIEEEFMKERRLWLQLAYIVRACVLSNDEFEKINKNTITGHAHAFYKNYEKVYGPKNCTYSIHTVAAHILQMRGDEPLTARSAFIFENFYGEMKNLFCPGTISPLKQVLKNCFIKRQLQPHQCQSQIKYSEMPSPENMNIGKENNHSVYVLNDEGHSMYNIIAKNDDNTFTCTKQGKYELEFKELKNLKWSSVGVYKLGPTCDQPVRIPVNEISGKVIHVHNYLITCPEHVLREK